MTLEQAHQEFFDNAFHNSMKPYISDDAKALAIVAIGEKIERDNPKPLSLVDITFMSGKPIYVSSFGSSYWAIVAEVDMRRKSFTLVSEIDNDEERSFSLYGKTWVAYKHKPKGV